MTTWYTGQREQIAAYARSCGPTTCGCVALLRWGRAALPSARIDPAVAWPLCPICAGTGRDPRVPVGVAATLYRQDSS